MKKFLFFIVLFLIQLTPIHGQWIQQMRIADQKAKEEKWQEAADLYTATINTTPDNTAKTECLQHRASCYKHLDRYDLALSDYESAIAQLTDKDVKAAITYNMSDLLIQTGQYARTISLLENIRFDNQEQDCRRLANLSTAYAYTGQGNKALVMLNDIISHHDKNDNTRARLLQNRGYILWSLNKYDNALQDLREALPQLHGNDYYITLANVALVEAEIGKYDQALQHIDEVLQWQAKAQGIGTHHSTYLISLRKKAEILLKAKQTQEAALTYTNFFIAEKDYVRTNFGNMTEQARLDFWLKENPIVSEIFTLGNVASPLLYDVALFRRNIALMGKRTAENNNLLKTALSHDHTQVINHLQSQEAAVEFVCYQNMLSGDSIYAAMICTKTGTRYVEIATKKSLHNHHIGNKALQQAVCQGARYASTIYTDSTLAAMIWAPLCHALPSTIKRLYFAPEGIFQMLGIEYLPYPAIQKLDIRRVSSTSRILSSSSTANGKVLVVGGLDYNQKNSYASFLSSSINHTAYATAKRICGTPLSFKNLPATILEADTIAHVMGTGCNRVMWEQELKQALNEYSVIHLATHGYSLEVALNPPCVFLRDSLRQDNTLWASGIALTGANIEGISESKEDGLLSARELCDIDLTNVKFIALSACQTAQGIVCDEGPAGMVRALKKAGAGTIIASLWAVNDKSTRLFMKYFYHAWRIEHKEIHTAFRQAQQAIQQHAITQVQRSLPTILHRNPNTQPTNKVYPYRNPQYWAPFILID